MLRTTSSTTTSGVKRGLRSKQKKREQVKQDRDNLSRRKMQEGTKIECAQPFSWSLPVVVISMASKKALPGTPTDSLSSVFPSPSSLAYQNNHKVGEIKVDGLDKSCISSHQPSCKLLITKLVQC